MNRQFARAGRSGSVRRACGITFVIALAVVKGAEEPQSVEKLVAQLQTGDVPGRRDASYFLQRLGPKAKDALPALIKAIADEDKQVWSNSVAAIAAIGPDAKEAIPVLLEDLASKEGQGRGRRNFDRSQRMFRSAHALSRIGPAAIPPLIQGLSSDDATLRAGSAKALGGMGTVANESIPALIANLNHGDNDVQREVVEALAIMGADAKASLIPALSDKESRTRQSAVLALAAMGKDSNDVAAVMLERLSVETDTNVRISLLTALPKLGADSKILVPRLIEGLNDSNESIRRASVNGLLSFPTAKKEIVEALTNQVRDKNKESSLRAAYVLGRFGSGAESAVPALLDVASMQTPPDQILVEALVQVGEPVVPRLLSAAEKVPLDQMTSEHWMVKCLQSMGSFAVNPVRNGLGHKNPSVRLLSVRALTALGRDAEDAATSLLEKLDDPDVRVRAAALGALVSVEA
ncbi:MAG TPA: HEAT repeat domain-containing protein, partial [Chthoniobacteraceae bacterium]|nr:HEAT repeat domain-containing protein [Chthoniobacteraceae bacterium]